NIQGMSKNSKLSRHILDCGWGKFFDMLEYKAEQRRVPAPRTSQTCNLCSDVNPLNRVSQSKFKCRACGHEENADVNAAKNILKLGYQLSSDNAGCLVRA